MAVGPQLRERLLAAREPRRHPVRGPLGHLGQGQADAAQPRGQVIVAVHKATVPSRAAGPARGPPPARLAACGRVEGDPCAAGRVSACGKLLARGEHAVMGVAGGAG